MRIPISRPDSATAAAVAPRRAALGHFAEVSSGATTTAEDMSRHAGSCSSASCARATARPQPFQDLADRAPPRGESRRRWIARARRVSTPRATRGTAPGSGRRSSPGATTVARTRRPASCFDSNAELATEIPRLSSRQQQPSQHRPKRVGTRLPRPLRRSLRRHVCLLRGDPALLHGEAGDVTRSVDVGHSVDAAVRVDRNEAVHGLRQPVDGSSLEPRKRNRHGPAGRRPSGMSLSSPSANLPAYAPVRRCHLVLLEQRADGLLAGRPNNCSGSASGVTSVSSTPCTPRARMCVAVRSASS